MNTVQQLKTHAKRLCRIISLAAVIAWPLSARAGTMYYDPSRTYHSATDSPFWQGSAGVSSGTFRLENFEHGLVSVAGVHATGGIVQGPSSLTHSVEGGTQGHSYLIHPGSTGHARAVFTFDRSALGGRLPTFAGLVWTNGRTDATVTFKAFDALGHLIGKIVTHLGGSSDNDRFLGAKYSQGISRIVISASVGDLEIDHLQFGFTNFAMSAVPLPPAVALGAVGLLGVALTRNRFARTRSSPT